MAKRLLRPRLFVVRCGSDVPPVIMRGYSIEQCVRSLGAVTRMLGTAGKHINLAGWSWAHLPRIQTWHWFPSAAGKRRVILFPPMPAKPASCMECRLMSHCGVQYDGRACHKRLRAGVSHDA